MIFTQSTIDIPKNEPFVADSVEIIEESIDQDDSIGCRDEKYTIKYVELEANRDIWEFPEWFESQCEDPQTERLHVRITHYCPCFRCNGTWTGGPTASGAKAVAGTTIAVDPRVIPLGSKVQINGHIYIAQDTGVVGNAIDIFVNSHEEALQKGLYYTDVEVFG